LIEYISRDLVHRQTNRQIGRETDAADYMTSTFSGGNKYNSVCCVFEKCLVLLHIITLSSLLSKE